MKSYSNTTTRQELANKKQGDPIEQSIRNECDKSAEDNKKQHQRRSVSNRRGASKLAFFRHKKLAFFFTPTSKKLIIRNYTGIGTHDKE